MEEIGGDPLQITVNTVSVTRIYGSVSEFSTPSLLSRENHPAVHLRCQKGKRITDIEFASYGNPVEDCRESGRSCHGSCHAEMSEFVVKNVKFYCLTSYMLMPSKYNITKVLPQSTKAWQQKYLFCSFRLAKAEGSAPFQYGQPSLELTHAPELQNPFLLWRFVDKDKSKALHSWCE